jgi:hypothetical protein
MKKDKEVIREVAKLITPDDLEVMVSDTPLSSRQHYIEKVGAQLLAKEITAEEVANDLHLTAKQMKFCMNFAIGEMQGDGLNAMIEAYDYDPDDGRDRRLATQNMSRFLKPTHPCSSMIAVLLYGAGLNPSTVDKELLFVIQQNFDLKAKTIAIREANTLFGRNNKRIIEVNITHKLDYSSLSDQKLRQFIELAEQIKVQDEPTV